MLAIEYRPLLEEEEEDIMAPTDSFLVKDGTLQVPTLKPKDNFNAWFIEFETETKAKGWNDADRLNRIGLFLGKLRTVFDLVKVDNDYEASKREFIEAFDKKEEDTEQRVKVNQKLYESYEDFTEFILDKLYHYKKMGIGNLTQVVYIKSFLPHWIKNELATTDTTIPKIMKKSLELERKFAIKCGQCGAKTHLETRCPGIFDEEEETPETSTQFDYSDDEDESKENDHLPTNSNNSNYDNDGNSSYKTRPQSFQYRQYNNNADYNNRYQQNNHPSTNNSPNQNYQTPQNSPTNQNYQTPPNSPVYQNKPISTSYQYDKSSQPQKKIVGRPVGIKNNEKWKNNEALKTDRKTRSSTKVIVRRSPSPEEYYDAEATVNSTTVKSATVNSVLFREYYKKSTLTKICMNGKEFYVLIDTGSEASVITKRLADDLNLKISKYKGPVLEAATVQSITPLGEVDITVKLCNVQKEVTFIVVNKLPSNLVCLFGTNAYKQMGLIMDLDTGEVENKVHVSKSIPLPPETKRILSLTYPGGQRRKFKTSFFNHTHGNTYQKVAMCNAMIESEEGKTQSKSTISTNDTVNTSSTVVKEINEECKSKDINANKQHNENENKISVQMCSNDLDFKVENEFNQSQQAKEPNPTNENDSQLDSTNLEINPTSELTKNDVKCQSRPNRQQNSDLIKKVPNTTLVSCNMDTIIETLSQLRKDANKGEFTLNSKIEEQKSIPRVHFSNMISKDLKQNPNVSSSKESNEKETNSEHIEYPNNSNEEYFYLPP